MGEFDIKDIANASRRKGEYYYNFSQSKAREWWSYETLAIYGTTYPYPYSKQARQLSFPQRVARAGPGECMEAAESPYARAKHGLTNRAEEWIKKSNHARGFPGP